MKKIIPALLFSLFTGPILAAEVYVLASEIRVGSEVIGAPVVMVNAGEESTVKVAGVYRLSVKVTPTESGDILVATNLVIKDQSASPSMLVNLDEEFSMKAGAAEISMVVSQPAPDKP